MDSIFICGIEDDAGTFSPKSAGGNTPTEPEETDRGWEVQTLGSCNGNSFPTLPIEGR